MQAINTLRKHIDRRDIRMEIFVELGRAIATIGKRTETEAVADKCWRRLRIAMDLVSQSKGAHRPFAHLNDGTHEHDLNGHHHATNNDNPAE